MFPSNKYFTDPLITSKGWMFPFVVIVLITISCSLAQDRPVRWDPELTEVWEPVPKIVTPVINDQPPSDAIILFDGKDLDQWESASHEYSRQALFDPDVVFAPVPVDDPRRTRESAEWSVENGYMTVVPGKGAIMTRRGFGDMQLHIEWKTPEKIDGYGQGRGNSGIFLQGLYEIQILDSYDNKTYSNGQAGSVYKQAMPLVNASLPPGEWQTYDIFFESPIFYEDGRLAKPAYVTVVHNGVLIQNHVEIRGRTVYRGLPRYKKHPEKLPIWLQDHSDRVSFRNIWVREL